MNIIDEFLQKTESIIEAKWVKVSPSEEKQLHEFEDNCKFNLPNDYKEMLKEHGSFYLDSDNGVDYELLNFESINGVMDQIDKEYLNLYEAEDEGDSPELTEDIYILKHSIPVLITFDFFILLANHSNEGLILALLTHDEGIIKKGKYSLENLFILLEKMIKQDYSDNLESD